MLIVLSNTIFFYFLLSLTIFFLFPTVNEKVPTYRHSAFGSFENEKLSSLRRTKKNGFSTEIVPFLRLEKFPFREVTTFSSSSSSTSPYSLCYYINEVKFWNFCTSTFNQRKQWKFACQKRYTLIAWGHFYFSSYACSFPSKSSELMFFFNFVAVC